MRDRRCPAPQLRQGQRAGQPPEAVEQPKRRDLRRDGLQLVGDLLTRDVFSGDLLRQVAPVGRYPVALRRLYGRAEFDLRRSRDALRDKAEVRDPQRSAAVPGTAG
jgi:hypothetical protein